MYTTLISTEELAALAAGRPCVIVDCRFDLNDTAKGRLEYDRGHIPGAYHGGLEPDLSGPRTETSGRHPLPPVDVFLRTVAAWGVEPGVQVIAYDDKSGMWASRLWWMLRLVGHDAVAVLDGGLAKWRAEGRPLDTVGPNARNVAETPASLRADMQMSVTELLGIVGQPGWRLVDARSAERFRGESEPIDRVAGHVPGAVNAHFGGNLTPDGTFRPAHELRAHWQAILGDTTADRCVCYCGSGVSACHNLLALEQAGLPGAKLYVGSWSEWSRNPERPVETGPARNV
ncbi:MAG: sulfurtransferase [Vicinamibacterales bacterium]